MLRDVGFSRIELKHPKEIQKGRLILHGSSGHPSCGSLGIRTRKVGWPLGAAPRDRAVPVRGRRRHRLRRAPARLHGRGGRVGRRCGLPRPRLARGRPRGRHRAALEASSRTISRSRPSGSPPRTCARCSRNGSSPVRVVDGTEALHRQSSPMPSLPSHAFHYFDRQEAALSEIHPARPADVAAGAALGVAAEDEQRRTLETDDLRRGGTGQDELGDHRCLPLLGRAAG